MNDTSQPADIARETLRRLAARRLPPTPENFRTLYHEIAGTAATEAFPERALKGLLPRLPRTSPIQIRFARQIEDAVAAQDWQSIGNAVGTVLAIKDPPPWSALIRELLAQLERRQAGITSARKREGLEHILSSSTGDPERLFGRLTALVKSWSQASSVGTAALPQEFPDSPAAEPAPAAAVGATPAAAAEAGPAQLPAPIPSAEVRRPIGDLLAGSVALMLVDDPELAAEATALSDLLSHAADASAMQAFVERLDAFVARLQWLAVDQADLKAALLHLMQLVVDNVAELLADDQWLHGQIAMVSEALAPPLNLRRLGRRRAPPQGSHLQAGRPQARP